MSALSSDVVVTVATFSNSVEAPGIRACVPNEALGTLSRQRGGTPVEELRVFRS